MKNKEEKYEFDNTIKSLKGSELAVRIGMDITRELNEKKDEEIEIQINAKPRLGMSSVGIEIGETIKKMLEKEEAKQE